MPAEWSAFVPGAGIGGLFGVVAFIVKTILDARKDKREGVTSVVTDAAAANTVLLATMKDLRAENARLTSQMAVKDAKILELERRVEAAEAEMTQIRAELRGLRSQ